MASKNLTHNLVVLSLLSVTLLCGCATTPNTAALEAEGAARHVPVLIYYTSWSSPFVTTNRMEVQLINTQDKDIASIRFLLANCERLRDLSAIKSFTLKGPFLPVRSYTAYPALPNGFVPYALPYRGVIVEIKVISSDGMEREYLGKGVAQLLGKNVVNSCSG
ncbi:MAG TPA: hypothetical protein VJS89_02265 [Gammaproteobacteria bacterium]|nr:hypothetical protein [Gammaproteobacteria bacterium]